MSSPSGLTDTARRMVSGVPRGLPKHTTPPAGVALALRAPGLDETAAAGFRGTSVDGAEPAPLTVDTHHDLASVTKIVATTTALLRLVSAGAVGLDDEVRHYLSDFGAGKKATVTVRDLLLHRAGLSEWYPLYLAAEDAQTATAFVDRMPLRYRPRSGRHYSDLGFMMLGRIIAQVAAEPLQGAIATLVTGPLQMSSTRFARPAGDEVAMSSFGDQVEIAMIDTGVPYPTPYRSDDFTSWRRSPVVGTVNDGNAFHVFAGTSGHAGLFSTLADLVMFADTLASYEEHSELWKPEVAREFFAPGPDADQALGFRRYCLDLGSEHVTMLGHPGFVGCAVGFVPGRGIALALASNRLLTTGVPVPTDELWQQALVAAGATIGELTT